MCRRERGIRGSGGARNVLISSDVSFLSSVFLVFVFIELGIGPHSYQVKEIRNPWFLSIMLLINDTEDSSNH